MMFCEMMLQRDIAKSDATKSNNRFVGFESKIFHNSLTSQLTLVKRCDIPVSYQ